MATRRRNSFLKSAAACAIALALLAGCGSDDADDDRSAESTPTAPAAAATPDPAALSPGRITAEVFAPKLSLEVTGEGWTLGDDNDEVFAVEHDIARGGSRVGYIAVFTPQELRDPELFARALPLPPSFVDWLATHRDVTVKAGPGELTIGGLPARQIEVATDLAQNVPLFDDWGMSFEDRVQVIEVRVDGEMTLIISGGDNPYFFEEWRTLMDPVIASILFERAAGGEGSVR
jgi:hypothetical protein